MRLDTWQFWAVWLLSVLAGSAIGIALAIGIYTIGTRVMDRGRL